MQGASLISARMEMGRDQLARALNRCLGCKAGVATFGSELGLVKHPPVASYIIVSGEACRNPQSAHVFD
jgi:hypothetical protein